MSKRYTVSLILSIAVVPACLGVLVLVAVGSRTLWLRRAWVCISDVDGGHGDPDVN